MAPFAKIKEILGRNRMNSRGKEINQQAQDIPFEDDLDSLLQGQVENTNNIGASSSSSAPVKTKNLNLVPRGRNKCKKAAHLSAGKKLRVAFYEGRVAGDDGNEFTRYFGKIVHNPNLCPVRVHKWEDLDSDNVEHMWAVLQEKFESEDMEQERTSTINHMKEIWRKWQGKMFQDHVKNKSMGQAITRVPRNMDKYDWEWLVRVYYHSDNYKKIGGKNSENRGAVTMPQRTGSKPFRQIKYDMGGSSGNPPSFEKFWFDTHKTGNILNKPETVEKHEMIKKTIQENPEMEVFDVIEECFGRQNKGYVVGYGGSVKPKDLRGPLPNRFDLEMKLNKLEMLMKCYWEE
ncbi:uncharacterized protein [Spinacia oleracea]|uniref:Myb/SANT-like domain-containing protein n=1 Tax=Spinacia oleracea TaxID=3562 RepID=A0ABM3QPC9_SPIOL|nr:uncharacterized protein LOC110781202 [Spinacia oleracea]XP_056685214.1 uncharacterized protein LOC110781202 [Spinacia oleracea]